MSERARLDFVLAVGEATSNAVRHGGGETFSVRCYRGDGHVTVDVIDSGPGFPPRSIEPSAGNECGAYGMLVIYTLADEIHLLESGSKVRLVKRLRVRPEASYRAGETSSAPSPVREGMRRGPPSKADDHSARMLSFTWDWWPTCRGKN